MTEPIPALRLEPGQLERIIAGLTEGVIVVGADRKIGWANQIALSMHGVQSLAELGSTIEAYGQRFDLRYRNRHRVQPEQYPMLRAIAGEGFSDVVVEVGPVGKAPQWTHRLRSLVLENAERGLECGVLILNDETERFDAEERFERAFDVNPAPALICRLSDLRYIKVNRGFEEMTGYRSGDILQRSIYEIDVLHAATGREQAIAHLHAGRTIPQMEALLALPGGGRKSVIVAGQTIECGHEACMLFTFVDLDPRRMAEDALRKSEERFAKSFRMGPLPMLISTLDEFRTLDANDAFLAAFGYEAHETIGRTASGMPVFGDPASRRAFERGLLASGSLRNLEMALLCKSGEKLDCLVSAETVSILDQICVLCVLQDVTERKRSESELVQAIEAVLREPSWFSRTVIEKLANLRLPQGAARDPALDDLSAREGEVLGLICRGLTDAEIAGRLQVSRNTVRNQVASIYSKIGVNRRSGAIVWARQRGFTGDADGTGPRPPARKRAR